MKATLIQIVSEETMPNLLAAMAIRPERIVHLCTPAMTAASKALERAYAQSGVKTAVAIRDLRVYIDFLHGRVEKYHDKTGLECDAVLHLPDGKYALVEIKLGGETLIAEGIATLRKLDMLIRGKGFPPPTFKMVLTATGKHAYSDGDAIICPIGSIKP